MHSCHATLKHRKSRTAQLGGRFKINAAQIYADIDVIFWREIEHARRAETAHFDVFGLRLSRRHVSARNIRNGAQKSAELFLQPGECDFIGLQFVADA